LEVPLPGDCYSDRSARLTQSGLRYFIAIFDGTTRVDQAAIKPCDSSNSIMERFKLPRAVADQFAAKLAAISGDASQASGDSSTAAGERVPPAANAASVSAEEHQTDGMAAAQVPPVSASTSSTSGTRAVGEVPEGWVARVWGAVPAQCTCPRPATCQHSISDAQWMEYQRATAARCQRLAIADGTWNPAEESWEERQARRAKEKSLQPKRKRARKRASEHGSEDEDDVDEYE